jgi:hypothetical protein
MTEQSESQATAPADVYSPPRLVTFLCLSSQSPFGALPAKSTKSNCFEPQEALHRAATCALSKASPPEREQVVQRHSRMAQAQRSEWRQLHIGAVMFQNAQADIQPLRAFSELIV